MTFVLTGRLVAVHDEGSLDCSQGWCHPESDGTPVAYPHDCGGVVHGDFVANVDKEWIVQLGCDHCDFRQQISQPPADRYTPQVPPKNLRSVDHPPSIPPGSDVPPPDPPPPPVKKAAPVKKSAKK